MTVLDPCLGTEAYRPGCWGFHMTNRPFSGLMEEDRRAQVTDRRWTVGRWLYRTSQIQAGSHSLTPGLC